jgi:hypothetical protein
MSTPKALSIRAPWWWFILHGRKDIENRDWATGYRGRVYIHASKWWSKIGVQLAVEVIIDIVAKAMPDSTIMVRETDIKPFGGCIVGYVDVVDCVKASASPWFFGEYGFVLANPVALATPVPCKGALGFFPLPADVMAQIEAQL